VIVVFLGVVMVTLVLFSGGEKNSRNVQTMVFFFIIFTKKAILADFVTIWLQGSF